MAHIFYHPHRKDKSKKKVSHALDAIIYPMAIVSPIMTIPQISDIWMHRNVAGLSLLTWGSYAVVSTFWLAYGIHHKEKPIIIGNILLIIAYSLVSAGILLFR